MESETVSQGATSILSQDTAISVAASHETAIIHCIENGEYVEEGAIDDDTRSLTDSIRQHIVDGGLRYHAYHAGKYAFPNDETEQYRDDLKHHLTLHLCENSYFHAPIHNILQHGAHVLDLGKVCHLLFLALILLSLSSLFFLFLLYSIIFRFFGYSLSLTIFF